MKFSRTFGVVRRLNNFDLNVTGIICTINRACDEAVRAEEYLTRRSGNEDNIESRSIFSLTDNRLDHGYYILFNDDAAVVAVGISNEKDPINYHIGKESNLCETRNSVIEKETGRRTYEMFRVSESGELGKGIMKAFGLHSGPSSYWISKNSEVPINITVRHGQIIFSQ